MNARADYQALAALADSSVPMFAPLVTIWAAAAALDEIDRLRDLVAQASPSLLTQPLGGGGDSVDSSPLEQST